MASPFETTMMPCKINKLCERLASNDPNQVIFKVPREKYREEQRYVVWASLAAALPLNSFLRDLNLEKCQLCDTGIVTLTRGLKHNRSVETLQLMYNNIGVVGGRALAGLIREVDSPPLKKINLAHNSSLGNDGAIVLGQAIAFNSTLQEIDLSVCRLGDDAALQLWKGLLRNSSLRSVNVETNDIGPGGTKGLTEVISTSRTLAKLNLSENLIGDEGAVVLARGFNASGTACSMNDLLLDGCNIGNDGATALCKSLVNCSSLKTVDLVGNLIKKDAMPAVANLVRENCSIQTLLLSENEIGNDGAVALASGFGNNPSSNLREIVLTATEIGVKGVKALVPALAQHASIESVTLAENDLGNEGAKALADLIRPSQAVSPSLAECDTAQEGNEEEEEKKASAMDDEPPQPPPNRCKLRELFLWSSGISDPGAIALAEALHGNETLETIHVAKNKIKSQGAIAFANAVQNNRKLARLFLGLNELGDEGAVAVAGALYNNKAIRKVCLYDCNLTDVSARAFGPTLKVNSVLKYLDMDHNSISDEGVIVLAESLDENKSLTRLGLRWNDFGEKGTRAVIKMLKTNTRMTEMGLSTPPINFYLSINRIGRQLLRVDNAPSGLWAHMLAKVGNQRQPLDASMIFYFLQQKPNLCSFVTGSNRKRKRPAP